MSITIEHDSLITNCDSEVLMCVMQFFNMLYKVYRFDYGLKISARSRLHDVHHRPLCRCCINQLNQVLGGFDFVVWVTSHAIDLCWKALRRLNGIKVSLKVHRRHQTVVWE